MFSFPLVMLSLLYQSYMFLNFTCLISVQVSRKFLQRLELQIFFNGEVVRKIPEKIKSIFHVKSDPEAPRSDQGAPLAQAARWRRHPLGRVHKAPEAHKAP